MHGHTWNKTFFFLINGVNAKCCSATFFLNLISSGLMAFFPGNHGSSFSSRVCGLNYFKKHILKKRLLRSPVSNNGPVIRHQCHPKNGIHLSACTMLKPPARFLLETLQVRNSKRAFEVPPIPLIIVRLPLSSVNHPSRSPSINKSWSLDRVTWAKQITDFFFFFFSAPAGTFSVFYFSHTDFFIWTRLAQPPGRSWSAAPVRFWSFDVRIEKWR